jgi:hypothetical protein
MPDTTPENDPRRNGLVVLPLADPAEQAQQAEPQDPAPANDEQPRKRRQVPAAERRHLRAVEAVRIAGTPPSKADLIFTVREFIACTLPHSDPGPALSWSRTNGNFTLGIVSGVNVQTGKPYGIPYGIIPRLLLIWMVTEITRTRSRRLELGRTLSEFLAKLGLSSYTGRGVRGDAKRVQEQMERLFRASICFLQTSEFVEGGAWDDGMKIATRGALWWSQDEPEQTPLRVSWVEVGQELFDSVLKSPNPLDFRVLCHIKDSSLGIDLYTILNREAFLAMKDGKTRFLAWEWIMERTGNEYGDIRDFRRKALEQIKAIMEVHPGLILKIVKGRKGQKAGIEISHLSRPSILPEEPKPAPPIIEGQARPAPSLPLVPPPAPEPPPERFLKPATVEAFCARYPRLDPYECKAAFDRWQAGLDPEKRARHYDKAFNGFARRWIIGKIVVSNP